MSERRCVDCGRSDGDVQRHLCCSVGNRGEMVALHDSVWLCEACGCECLRMGKRLPKVIRSVAMRAATDITVGAGCAMRTAESVEAKREGGE
jgi:hypothetical protein